MPKENKYKLRAGVLLHYGRGIYSNANLTDKIAIAALVENENRKSMFSKLPDNVDAVLAARKAEAAVAVEEINVDELKASLVEAGSKIESLEKVKYDNEVQIESLKKKKATLEETVDTLNAKVSALETELANAKEQLNAAKTPEAPTPADSAAPAPAAEQKPDEAETAKTTKKKTATAE